MADDELEVIQAIYCQPEEICIVHGGTGSKEVKVRLKAASTEGEEEERSLCLHAELCLFLPSSYPSTPPDISVLSDKLSRKDVAHLRSVLCANAAQHLDQPMLLDLITLASEELHRLVEEQKNNAQGENRTGVKLEEGQERCAQTLGCESRLALLHLDHMRAKTQYLKLIKKWVTELNLNGGLVFCQRLILIVLQGSSSAIKDYIVRQRTSNVDVDSRGQPCKERMLSVLCDVPVAPHHLRFEDFRVEELSTADELKQLFTKWCLQDIFLEHVSALKHFPGR